MEFFCSEICFSVLRCGSKSERREAKSEKSFKSGFCARNISTSTVSNLLTKSSGDVAGDMIKELLEKKRFSQNMSLKI